MKNSLETYMILYNIKGVREINLQELREYCTGKKGVTECFPFDEKTLVFKVGSKMFALTDIEKQILEVNLKCDPIMSVDLRKDYSAIRPGYHMNKKYWNTVTVDGTISKEKIKFLIDFSYDLVFSGLKKAERLMIMQNEV